MKSTNLLFSILAQGEAGAPSSGAGSLLGGPIPLMLIMFAFMYLLIIRPQQKQRKEQEARMASLKKGDQVITAGGVHASVHHVSERTVTLKLSEGVFVPFEKSSVTQVVKATKEKASKSGDEADREEES